MKQKKTKFQRIPALLLAAALILTLAGCGSHDFDSYRPITDVNHLEGRKIGVNLAWSADYLLSERDDVILYRYDELSDMLMALCFKQLDAVAIDYVSGVYIMAKTQGLHKVEQNLAEEGYIVVFNREREALCEEFNAWLTDYMTTEEYAAWKQRILDFDGDNYEPQIPEQTGTGSVIRCATYLDNYPLSYMDAAGNQLGFDMELMIAFANARNYRLDITMTSETDMESGLFVGRYDLDFSSLSELYAEDYRVNGFFVSDDYITLPICILEIAEGEELKISGVVEAWGEE